MSFLGLGDTAIGSVADTIKDGIDKIWPNPGDEAAAKVLLIKAQVDAAVATLDAQNRAANAEAASADPWTSRARPSFLYVMYALILFSVPMGLVSAYDMATASQIADGMKDWLAAVPPQLWDVFGLSFAVYTGGRSYEKVKGVTK